MNDSERPTGGMANRRPASRAGRSRLAPLTHHSSRRSTAESNGNPAGIISGPDAVANRLGASGAGSSGQKAPTRNIRASIPSLRFGLPSVPTPTTALDDPFLQASATSAVLSTALPEHTAIPTHSATILQPQSAFSEPFSSNSLSPKVTIPIDELVLTNVLTKLADLDLITTLIRRWKQITQMCLVPLTFLEEILISLKESTSGSNKVRVEVGNFASQVLSATSQPFMVPTTTEAADFHRLFTGSNMRVEGIGLISSVSGLAAMKLPASDEMFADCLSSKAERKNFATNMLSVSNTCIELASKCCDTNDFMVWLRVENLTLTMYLEGSASYHTWHRSGQLFNDLLSLKVYRELEVVSAKPLFLEEIRRRFFASAYRTDKSLSSLLERPPRLLHYYCNRKLPLHLNDEQLMAPEQTLQKAIDSLQEDGWNAQPHFCPTAWLRARYMLSTFREEILNVQLGPGDANKTAALRNISRRIPDAWTQLPPYMRYDASCWDTNPSSNICFMLAVVNLEYLDLRFNVEKLLYIFASQENLNSDNSALLEAATSLLTTAMSSSRQLSRNSGAYTDYVWNLSSYGLPSATVLALMLKGTAELGHNLVHPKPWSELFRQLSALASDLEAIAESDNDNHPHFRQGSKVLLDTLDEALNARMTTPAVQAAGRTLHLSSPPLHTNSGFPRASNSGDIDTMALDEEAIAEVVNYISASDILSLDLNSFGDENMWLE
ncbi:hypothetical protein G7054_g6761 [Neopestalotiopsis clavispora]|nr:hypothetical protein G7054_g6761 [Neopestalotiopsis clavispora]